MHFFFRIFFIMMCLLSLFNCKKEVLSDSPAEMKKQNGTKEIVTLKGWSVSSIEEELLLQVIADFEAEYPQYSVRYTPIQTNYQEKIVLDFQTGQISDVFYLDSSYAPYFITNGLLYSLNDFIEQDRVDIEDFEKPMLKVFTGESGQIYGLPKDYTTLALFYNPRLLFEAGISRPPRSWEELRSACEKLRVDTDGDGVFDRYGLIIEPKLARLLPFFYQNGGEFLTPSYDRSVIHSPENRETLDFFAALYDENLAVYAGQLDCGWDTEAFGKEKTAMIFSGNWSIPYLETEFPGLKYDTGILPYSKKKLTIAYTVAYAIPKTAGNPEGAWKLLNFLTGKKGMAKWTSLGLALPTRKSVVSMNPLFESQPRKVLVDSAPHSFVWSVGPKPEILDPINDILTLVFSKMRTSDEGLKEIEKMVNNALETE